MAQQLYGSTASAVEAPQVVESRGEELVVVPNERSKWYVTGGIIQSNIPTFVTCYVSCSKSTNPWGISLGAGYDVTDNWGVEAEIASLGSETINWSIYNGETKVDWYTLMLGGTFSYEISSKTHVSIGAGYYKAYVEDRTSWASGSSSYHYQSDNSFLSLGGAYQLSPSTTFRLKWTGFQAKQGLIEEIDKYQTVNLGVKYNF
jgi:opacity protein-like surface antigen